MKYSIVKGDKVINVIEADAQFADKYAEDNNVTTVLDGSPIGWTLVNGEWYPPEPDLQEIKAAKISEVRAQYRGEMEAKDPIHQKLKDKISEINLANSKSAIEKVTWEG